MKPLISKAILIILSFIFLTSCTLNRQIFESLSQSHASESEKKEIEKVDSTSEVEEPIARTRYQNVSSYYVLQDKEAEQSKKLSASTSKSSVQLVKEISSIKKAVQVASKVSPKQKSDNNGECNNCGLKSVTNALLLYFIAAPLSFIIIGIPLVGLFGYWSMKNGILAMKYGNNTQKILGIIGITMTSLTLIAVISLFVYFFGQFIFK